MPITKSKQRISDFQSHINSHAKEIRDVGDEAWQRVTSKGEVEIVREFLGGKGRGTDYLNSNITSLLGNAGRVVKFASIFLHQMPKVFGLRNHPSIPPDKLDSPCELGDLQTLFLYLDRDKNVCQARSVIFQAKLKPKTGKYVIDHPQQRELYDTCTGFEYDTVLKGKTRGLPNGHFRERALQYIFVEERPVRVRTIPSETGQGAFENYGEHLLRFLNDSTGLDVSPDRNTSEAWGKVVWDMIEHVANEVTSRGLVRNSGLKGVLDHFNHFENHDTFFIDTTGGDRLPEGHGGFGLQLVIVWDSELGGELALLGKELPIQLQKLAKKYLDINEPDQKKQYALKEQTSNSMAKLIFQENISPCMVLDNAKDSGHEGLIVAAVSAMIEKPHYDLSSLFAVANDVIDKYVQGKIILALQVAWATEKSRWRKSEMAKLVELYSYSADADLLQIIHEFQRELKSFGTQSETVKLKQRLGN